ncbi:unnamed protein product [Mycena citricolor]|uniref:Uncharacterized protein n=1 Tax=Mycena citricolor TaxID=2018698 RepID=A0AAD2HCE6_9AGAR|nr:unnamed protein product [Mycena citricolor]
MPLSSLYGSPRLPSAEADLQLRERLLSPQAFSSLRGGRRALSSTIAHLATMLMTQPENHPDIQSWVLYCIGPVNLTDAAAIKLFVEVQVWRAMESESMALDLLLQTQVCAAKNYVEPEISVDSVFNQDAENTDMGDAVLSALAAVEPTLQNTERSFQDLFLQWRAILARDFCLSQNPLSLHPDKSMKEVVEILQQLRLFKPSTYSQPAFTQALKSSGLADTLLLIINPLTRREIDFPHIQDTDGSYQWKQRFGELLFLFTPEDARELVVTAPSETKPHDRKKTSRELSCIQNAMTDRRFAAQLLSTSTNIFFLSSQQTWCHNWDIWVLPTLLSLGYSDAATWDSTALYRRLVALQSPSVHPKVAAIFKRAASERALQKEAIHGSYRPAGSQSSKRSFSDRQQLPEQSSASAQSHLDGCKKCMGYPDNQKCVQYIFVEPRSTAEIKSLQGCIITYATRENMPPGLEGYSIQSPDDLGYRLIGHRSEVYQRCQQDVTILVDKNTQQKVAGIKFQAMDSATLKKAQCNHETVVTYTTKVKRSGNTRVHGDLHPVGSRVPSGGRPGDGYGPYASLDAHTTNGVAALFAAAEDADVLFATVNAFAPEITRGIETTSRDAGVSYLGRHGGTAYHCTNYVAPLHLDHDLEFSLTSQLKKSGDSNDYNFVVAQYGIVFCTIANSVWFFRPDHLHGTVLPSKANIATSQSCGTHTTLRAKDVKKATMLKKVRESYDSQAAFWSQ